jgi:hypothetical protein
MCSFMYGELIPVWQPVTLAPNPIEKDLLSCWPQSSMSGDAICEAKGDWVQVLYY